MKRWVGATGLLLATLLVWGSAEARTIKIGFVDVEELITKSEHIKSSIEPLKKKYEEQLDAIGEKKKALEEQGQSLKEHSQATGSDGVDIERLREDLQKSEQSLAGEMRQNLLNLRKDREDTLKPLILEVDDQIRKIGEEQGYDFIFRKVDVPFIKASCDITDVVIKRVDAELGKMQEGK